MKNVKDDNVALLSDPYPLTEDLLNRTINRHRGTVRPARKKKTLSPLALQRQAQQARKNNRRANLRLIDKRMEQGLCYRCGKREPLEGRKTCQICLDRLSELRSYR